MVVYLLYSEQNKYEDAEIKFKKALDLAPGHKSAISMLDKIKKLRNNQ